MSEDPAEYMGVEMDTPDVAGVADDVGVDVEGT